jgi:hypothetical protein
LNAIHLGAAHASAAGARGHARDAATLLDESGLLVACADPALVDLWRSHAWREAFLDRRLRLARALRFVVIGHGVLAKCAAPFRAITAKALVLLLDVAALPSDPVALVPALDRAAAACLAATGAALAPEDLLPLPIAALPGWDTENLGAQLYDDVSVFRPRPRTVRGAGRRAGVLSRKSRS